jgi:hypothetical protein
VGNSPVIERDENSYARKFTLFSYARLVTVNNTPNFVHFSIVLHNSLIKTVFGIKKNSVRLLFFNR